MSETDEELQQLRTNASGDLMSDEDFIKTIEGMSVEAQEREINDLLKAMHENRIVSWDEAERILQETDQTPIKCSLPEQTRPSEPDNEVDVDQCIRKLLDNDPTLKEVNLNNMKRTPVPAIKRLLEALAYNEHCERISLANMGLYDHDIQILVTVIEMNQAIKKVNLETNYLSGEFFAKLFKAALNTETVEEIKAVNQGVSFSTQSEKEIINAIVKNHGLTKISINFRLPEGRHKVENATLRNGELKRMKRREAALKAKQEAEELAKNPVPKLAPEPKPEIKKPVPTPTPPAAKVPIIPKSLVSPEPKPSTASKPPEIPKVAITAKPSILARQLSYQRASRESEEDTELVNGNNNNNNNNMEKPDPPKRLMIPRMFSKDSEDALETTKPELQKVPKRPTKKWEPKKIDPDEDGPVKEEPKPEAPKRLVKKWEPKKIEQNEESSKKHWEPKAVAPVDQGYAPVMNLGGVSLSKPLDQPPPPPPKVRRPPTTAKNMWEQRIAKMEKKEEKKKVKPLLSIQKIREMEKNNAETEDKLDQLLKKAAEPKKLKVESKNIFEINGTEPPKPEKRSTQKILAKKPSALTNQNLKNEDVEEKRPTTVIRRTVMRKNIEGPPNEEKTNGNEIEPPVKRVLRKKKPVVPLPTASVH